MVVVPEEIPVTRPVAVLMIATDGVLLDQVPPETESARVTVAPAQRLAAPVIPDDTEDGCTVSSDTTLVGQPKLLVTV